MRRREKTRCQQFNFPQIAAFISVYWKVTGQESNWNQPKCSGKKETRGSSRALAESPWTSASVDAIYESCGTEINSMGSHIIFLPQKRLSLPSMWPHWIDSQSSSYLELKPGFCSSEEDNAFDKSSTAASQGLSQVCCTKNKKQT